MDKIKTLTGREQVKVGREYARLYGRDANLSQAIYRERLHELTREMYPGKKYPGERFSE